MSMSRCIWISVVVVGLAVPVFGVSVRMGTGGANQDWCPLGWWGSKAIGNAGLTEEGFLLSTAQTPPVPAYEIALKLVPYKELLFMLRSPSPAGKINLYLNDKLVDTVDVPTIGNWWMLVSDLPDSGILRIELGAYCDQLLIQSVNYRCQTCPPLWPWFILGAVCGALLTWVILR